MKWINLKINKRIILGISILILLIIFMLAIFWKREIPLRKIAPEFFELIESGNLDDISLTIYYRNPYSLTRPVYISVDHLVYGNPSIYNYDPTIEKSDIYGIYDGKIVVKGSKLNIWQNPIYVEGRSAPRESLNMDTTDFETGLLKEHIDVFIQLNNTAFKPVIKKSQVNAQIYYVFENEKGDKIFDVAMGTINGNRIVNGIEVKNNDILSNVIMPFLPEDVIDTLRMYFR